MIVWCVVYVKCTLTRGYNAFVSSLHMTSWLCLIKLTICVFLFCLLNVGCFVATIYFYICLVVLVVFRVAYLRTLFCVLDMFFVIWFCRYTICRLGG